MIKVRKKRIVQKQQEMVIRCKKCGTEKAACSENFMKSGVGERTLKDTPGYWWEYACKECMAKEEAYQLANRRDTPGPYQKKYTPKDDLWYSY